MVRVSPVKTEMRNLRAQIRRTDDKMDRISTDFWRNGGICCPGCGVRGYRELEQKQERRWIRLKGLERKLARDATATREWREPVPHSWIWRHNPLGWLDRVLARCARSLFYDWSSD